MKIFFNPITGRLDASVDVGGPVDWSLGYPTYDLRYIQLLEKGAINGVATLGSDGYVPIAQMNPSFLERLYVYAGVATLPENAGLTIAQVQNGDVVKMNSTGIMYVVKDDTQLNSSAGFEVFNAGTAASVPWTGITSIPANISSLESLTYASTSFVKMTAAGTFALDTNTYALSSDLSLYAKLDGSNQPFTGAISMEYGTGATLGAFDVDNINATNYGTAIWLNQSTKTNTNYAIRYDQQNKITFKADSTGSNSFLFEHTNGNQLTLLRTRGGLFLTNTSTAVYELINLTQVAITSASNEIGLFTATGGAHTSQRASTEVIDVNWNLDRTVTKQTGAVTTQRAFVIQRPTYAFAAASTITNAATFAITNAPLAGTNATITNPYSFWVQAGKSQFDGDIGIVGTSQNALVINNGIKIANNTDSAATAGAGSIRYSGTTLQFSDGSNWLTASTTTDLSLYAKLDGSNTPFTGNIRIEPTSGISLVLKGATSDSTTKALSVTDSSNVEYFYLRNDGVVRVEGKSATATFISKAFGATSASKSIQILNSSSTEVMSINGAGTWNANSLAITWDFTYHYFSRNFNQIGTSGVSSSANGEILKLYNGSAANVTGTVGYTFSVRGYVDSTLGSKNYTTSYSYLTLSEPFTTPGVYSNALFETITSGGVVNLLSSVAGVEVKLTHSGSQPQTWTNHYYYKTTIGTTTNANLTVTNNYVLHNADAVVKGTNKWFIYNDDNTVNSYLKGQLQLVGSAQNALVVTNGIKIGNNTDLFNIAGGGSLKYASDFFYGATSTAWRELAFSGFENNIITTASAAYTILATEYIINFTTTGSHTLPSIATVGIGKVYRLFAKNVPTTINIAGGSGDTIDGTASANMTGYSMITLRAIATNEWRIGD